MKAVCILFYVIIGCLLCIPFSCMEEMFFPKIYHSKDSRIMLFRPFLYTGLWPIFLIIYFVKIISHR